jgi:hypothetical protein
VLQYLLACAENPALPNTGLIPQAVWEGLIEQEWAEETPLGPVIRLNPVEEDWLRAVAAGASGVSEAHVLQSFLARAKWAGLPDEQEQQSASTPEEKEHRGAQIRLRELEARAHWLEEELAAARKQFSRATVEVTGPDPNIPASKTPAGGSAGGAASES